MVWMPIRNRPSSGSCIELFSKAARCGSGPATICFPRGAGASIGQGGGVAVDTIEKTSAGSARLLTRLPERLHHHAYVVKDHEANRRFVEDLLGIPLVATWCEKTYRADLGREVEFCHTFFALKDGGALAFFQFADEEMYELTQAKEPPKVGSHYHIALKASEQTYEELKARLNAAGEQFRETDHGYCKSIYTASPDGMI